MNTNSPSGSGKTRTETFTRLSQPLTAPPGSRTAPVGRDSSYSSPLYIADPPGHIGSS